MISKSFDNETLQVKLETMSWIENISDWEIGMKRYIKAERTWYSQGTTGREMLSSFNDLTLIWLSEQKKTNTSK